ncbi:hypothetical protein JXB11_01340 [Candidatus Woesearchaeota archaeon]|nr:hypothetical protein [Candidatus Woesearchaeota archaeon]
MVKKRVPEFARRIYRWGRRNKKAVIISLLVIAAAMLFTSQVRAIVSIGILALAGTFSQVYKRVIRIPPAFELVTFGTVLVGYVYGIWAGAIFGIVVTIAAEIASSAIDAFVIGYIPARASAGIAAAIAAGYNVNIFWAGMLGVVVYNVIAQPLYMIQPDVELRMKLVFFLTGNFVFNFVIFRVLGEPVLFLMTA